MLVQRMPGRTVPMPTIDRRTTNRTAPPRGGHAARRIRAGSADDRPLTAREATLAASAEPLARALVDQFQRRHGVRLDTNEAMSAAYLGVVLAARTFDAAAGVP